MNSLNSLFDTQKYEIIDGHAHLGPLSTFDIQRDGSIESMIAAMDRIGISRVAIAPHLGLKFDAERSNNMTAAAMKKYPGRIIGMATVNPNEDEKYILKELKRCFDSLHMTVIKLHPNESSCPMDRSIYDSIYGFANERGIPILNHDWGAPERLRFLAHKYTKINFLQAHNAGNWDCHYEDPFFQLARDTDNIFLDICASPIHYGALEKLVEIVGDDKLIFGTDAPFLNFAFGVGKVLTADISELSKKKIFAINYKKFIREE